MYVSVSGVMLKWLAVKDTSDGICVPYWYESVGASTGLRAHQKLALVLDMAQNSVVTEAMPYFHELYAQRLIPST